MLIPIVEKKRTAAIIAEIVDLIPMKDNNEATIKRMIKDFIRIRKFFWQFIDALSAA
jgi:hypothetical protein